MPLNDVAIRAAKPGPKPVKLSDEKGLFLLVQPSGGKLWRLAFEHQTGFIKANRRATVVRYQPQGAIMVAVKRQVVCDQHVATYPRMMGEVFG